MTGSVLKKMKKDTKEHEDEQILRTRGLRNVHTYTVIDVREVNLDTGGTEKLMFLRNPTGNFYCKDHEVW